LFDQINKKETITTHIIPVGTVELELKNIKSNNIKGCKNSLVEFFYIFGRQAFCTVNIYESKMLNLAVIRNPFTITLPTTLP